MKRMTVTEIHKILDIKQAIASNHLKINRVKKTLVAKREGKIFIIRL